MVLEDLRVPEADVARLAGEQIIGVFVLRILDHPKATRVEQQVFDDRPLRVLGMVRHRNWWLGLLLGLRRRCRLWDRLLCLILLLRSRKRRTLLATVLQDFGGSFSGMLLVLHRRVLLRLITWHGFRKVQRLLVLHFVTSSGRSDHQLHLRLMVMILLLEWISVGR